MSTRSRNFEDPTLEQASALSYPRTAVQPRARVEWTDAAGRHSVLVERCAVVGAARHADLVIADPAVSRLHAEIEPGPAGVWVRDLGSRNGTFVEGVQVSGARVPPGGRVRVGGTALTVSAAGDHGCVELWPSDRLGDLVGRSAVMRELFARIARVAATDATVCITGETGTGKELVAQAVHESSPRAAGPFVVVDCAALPENLLEAEVFGHARGAFTGAAGDRAGAVEAAQGGTVFFDEVGELPLAMQPKLLRVLESRTVRRLGEAQHRKVDVRFVAATHRDLRAMVNAGTFREDLYFRLAVVPLAVPPLRARLEDVPLLVERFLPAGASAAVDPGLLQELAGRSWPGNVRELRNFVERAVALGVREALALSPPAGGARGAAGESFPPVSTDEPFKSIRERWIDYLEREYFRQLLAAHHGSVSAVAEASGLNRAYVYRLLRKLNL